MIETIGKWLSAIMEWASIIPQQGWAILIGIILGGAITQWLKRTFPVGVLFPHLQKEKHVVIIRTIALLCAAVPTYIIWPDDQYEIWAALVIGFATPSIYRALTFFVYKKWPELEVRWSGTK